MRINQNVMTPLGKGVVQQAFGVLDEKMQLVSRGIIVRLPVNDQTRPQLKKDYCLTPRANATALFVFDEGKLK